MLQLVEQFCAAVGVLAPQALCVHSAHCQLWHKLLRIRLSHPHLSKQHTEHTQRCNLRWGKQQQRLQQYQQCFVLQLMAAWVNTVRQLLGSLQQLPAVSAFNSCCGRQVNSKHHHVRGHQHGSGSRPGASGSNWQRQVNMPHAQAGPVSRTQGSSNTVWDSGSS